ncbi:MAG: hypothetical protein K0Q95_233 [Bacteroidota bacterium]|jgi:hypothetical protein|nr:hypothetical protein [Bacteroidota bacterium]
MLRKIILRLALLIFLLGGTTFLLILFPGVLYPNRTEFSNVFVFHSQALDPMLSDRIKDAENLVERSEFHNKDLGIEICLNDGSFYPGLIQMIRGNAFAWGFYNKVVWQGTADCKNNFVELNNYRWNMSELLAHEMIHCIQFDHLGFWNSKPVADIPEWKWEGYAEYVSRKGRHLDLKQNIELYLNASKQSGSVWAVTFPDGTVAPKEYFRYRLLVQYCLEIKSMSYADLLKYNSKEEFLLEEMLRWFESH